MRLKKTDRCVTEFGAHADGETLNTRALQQAIDTIAEEGGATLVVPAGCFLTGALFFKPGVNLHLDKGAVLLGSNKIADYPYLPSRMEGVSQDYYSALVNASHCDNFTITGSGKIDGNGKAFWQAFWARREENAQCTNLEVARPRLIYINHSAHVKLEGVQLVNSGFWTTHLYQCQDIVLRNLTIFSPREPLRAPSTDGIDLDVCRDVHIDNCDISVNDDAVCIKGGKGSGADKDSSNGPVENVLIENCRFAWNHAVLTLGSEAVSCRNIHMRNCQVDGPWIVFRSKLRPDTPQKFHDVRLENIRGNAHTFLMIKDWMQFDQNSKKDSVQASHVSHLQCENIHLKCKHFRVIDCDSDVELSDFVFQDIDVEVEVPDQFSIAKLKRLGEHNLSLKQATYQGGPTEINEL